MLTAVSSHYLELIDSVRRNNRSCSTNIFLNAHELLDTLKEHETLLFQLNCQAVFLFVRYHNSYYDMIYVCSTEIFPKLAENPLFLEFIRKTDLPVRVGITGGYDKINEDAEIFKQCGFTQNRTVGKVSFNAPKNEYAEHFINTSSFLAAKKNENDTPNNNLVIAFADIADAREIFELLCEEFDLIEDSVPELDQIESDIKKKFIAIIRREGKIIAVNYYRIKNRIRSCIYEYVKKDFRTNGTMFLLNNFVNKHIAENENVIRTYGWRDITKKRLINVYRALGENFCNIYTTYLLFENEQKI